MPFQQPLVPSPTLSRSPPSPSSTNRLKPASSNFPPSAPSGSQASIGLGVVGTNTVQDQEVGSIEGKDVTSPVELTQFVDTLLNDLESRFDTISADVLSRLSSLSTRVDSLEMSLADLMSGTAAPVGPNPHSENTIST